MDGLLSSIIHHKSFKDILNRRFSSLEGSLKKVLDELAKIFSSSVHDSVAGCNHVTRDGEKL